MKERIWTASAYEAMFTLLPKIEIDGLRVGRYVEGWNTNPPHLTIKQWDMVCQLLLDQMIAKGVFLGKKPKSASAVRQQLAHATFPASNPIFANMRARLRMIAYREGFMDMCDIVDIDREAKRRRPVVPIRE